MEQTQTDLGNVLNIQTVRMNRCQNKMKIPFRLFLLCGKYVQKCYCFIILDVSCNKWMTSSTPSTVLCLWVAFPCPKLFKAAQDSVSVHF